MSGILDNTSSVPRFTIIVTRTSGRSVLMARTISVANKTSPINRSLMMRRFRIIKIVERLSSRNVQTLAHSETADLMTFDLMTVA